MAANTNINTLSVDCHRRSYSRAAKRTLELRENSGEFAEVEHPGGKADAQSFGTAWIANGLQIPRAVPAHFFGSSSLCFHTR